MTAAAPAPYRGPYPIRDNVTCADFDSNGVLGTKVGDARVWVYHNDLSWVMRISENGRVRHLMLGPDDAGLRRLSVAFGQVPINPNAFPFVMVGGVAFSLDEARQLFRLLTNALPESALQ
jgi:hypothetical protein